MVQKNSLLASATMLISGTGIAQLIALLALPVLSRIYTPADFGLFAVYMSLLSLATVVVCFRYELAIVLPKKERSAYQVFRLAILASCVSSLVFGSILYLSNTWLTNKYELKDASYILWVLPPSLFITGLMAAVTSWNNRNRSYRLLAVSKLAQSLPQTGTQLLLGFAAWGPLGLIAGEILGKASGFLVQWRGGAVGSTAYSRRVSFYQLKKMAAIYRRFPLVSSWSSILNQLGVVAPAIFLAAHFGPEIAGFYAMADRVLAIPMDLVGRSIQSLYIGEASKVLRQSPEKLRSLFITFASRMFLLGLIPVLLVLAFGEWALVELLGAKWQLTGEFAKILCISFLFRFAVSPLSQTLNFIQRQDIQLVWDAGRLIAIMGAFFAVVSWQLPPTTALISYAAVVVISQISYAAITINQLGRLPN